jgi:hypothetical protein
MKKKSLILAALLFVASTTGAFAFGIGLQANANAGSVFAGGPAVTFKVDAAPLIFAVNYYAGKDIQTFGVTGDYWIMNDKITSINSAALNWFWGVGFFANTTFEKGEDMALIGGIRVPLGLNMFLGKGGAFEPFLQVAPSFGVRFVPSLAAENLFFPISLGFRVWFK